MSGAPLVATFLLRAGRTLLVGGLFQIAADVVAATGLVYLTGGPESIFTILYPLAIVSGAIGLGRRGAAVGAAASSIAFCVLGWSGGSGFGEAAAYLERPPTPSGRPAAGMAGAISALPL